MKDGGDVVRLPPKGDPAAQARLIQQTGVAGTKIFSGLITDDYNPDLQGLKAVTVYDKMRRSEPVVQALLFAMELPIRSTRWYIEPQSDDPVHVGLGDFVHDALFNFGHQTFDDYNRLALGQLWAGYSILEKMFSYDERGYLLWDEFAYRHQNTVWRWNPAKDNEDRLESITQLAPPTFSEKTMLAEKVLLHTFRREGNNYQGLSVLRPAYKPWFFLSYLEKIANIGYERMTGGLPVMTIPDGAEDELTRLAKSTVENLRMGDEMAGVLLPASLALSIIEVGGKMMDHLNAYLEAQRLAIARAGLAAFTQMPGSGTGGGMALSRDSSQLFLDSLAATADQQAAVFNQDAIPQLLNLNFQGIKREDYPRLVHGKIGQREFRFIGRTLGELVKNALLTPGPNLEEHIREMLDLPEIPEEQRAMTVDVSNEQQQTQNDRGAAGQPAAPAAAAVPMPSNLPAARLIMNQPWRPSTRMRMNRQPYVIRTASEAKPKTREDLNQEAERRVESLRSVIARAMRAAAADARAVIQAQQPVVSASDLRSAISEAGAATSREISAAIGNAVAAAAAMQPGTGLSRDDLVAFAGAIAAAMPRPDPAIGHDELTALIAAAVRPPMVMTQRGPMRAVYRDEDGEKVIDHLEPMS